MPGVPSSKACEACRKVKKKCDELQPCSRCLRLSVPCAGSGRQRYKFKNADSNQMKPERTRDIVLTKQVASPTITHVPTNRLAACFINTLGISDIRYDITFYGPFLKDLPRRLGHSAALDAATKALVSSYPYFHGREVPHGVLIHYGKSLRTLRETLNDPAKIQSPDTLCAIYLISICQGWLRKHEKQQVSHGQAIAHLLKIIDVRKWDSGFERDLLITMSVPVIFEGLGNPRIRMPSGFWESIMALIPPGSPPQDENLPRSTTTLLSLSKFPGYLQRPYPYLAEITEAYTRLREDGQRIRSFLDQWVLADPACFSSSVAGQRSRYQAGYTVVTALALLLNALLRALDSSNTTLSQESAFFCEQIIAEAESACNYRPLGAAYVAPCLVVALAVTEGPWQWACIETIFRDYEADSGDLKWREIVMWLRAAFRCHRMGGGTVENNSDVDISALGVPGACCMM
ncbi:hypothetical protein N7448_008006 [Penicillium atrosanguineum]|uniref:Uncharacterized protein n=1 Tax=Penicillium atrosanguineum TaxID=1132637 RepID=A0A9W9GQD2_9EURO|nr:uncharacterized protein N7443_000974 [Penicillium atrosanguineum]KAJ5127227.1 hypothetical protein N7448_008006 [Penicillium atrosanguineum]KAJ5147433.1 hypothetical protein N7526_000785 [Penicillium atrosanguineum]KAJ5314090.1 hypothetical protein N7443_000974 [Penicillium atrosanguineum]KAJ5331255.1 hypothetical protein N7476_001038 [Penicillium atrosanguineum]